jgi:hypothetical protein
VVSGQRYSAPKYILPHNMACFRCSMKTGSPALFRNPASDVSGSDTAIAAGRSQDAITENFPPFVCIIPYSVQVMRLQHLLVDCGATFRQSLFPSDRNICMIATCDRSPSGGTHHARVRQQVHGIHININVCDKHEINTYDPAQDCTGHDKRTVSVNESGQRLAPCIPRRSASPE